MKTSGDFIAKLFVAASLFVAAAWAEEKTDALDELKGVWVREQVLHAGQEVPPDKFPYQLHFDGNKLIFRFVGEVKGKDRIHDIQVDATKTPAEMSIVRQLDDRKLTVPAIYKIEDGRLMICFFRDSNERPTQFESTAEIKSDLLVLKRKDDEN